MKSSRFKITPRTLAGRLTQWIILTLLLTMTAIAWVIYGFSKNAMAEEAENRYQGFVLLTNMRVDNELNMVELATANNVAKVANNLDRPDRIRDVLAEILANNPNIVGCGVGFAPDYYPQLGHWYELYALRKGDGVELSQIGGETHDYFNSEWYSAVSESGKSHWTDPYFDDAGGKMPLFTYSMPVRDEKGRVVAVLGADVSLQWLKSMLREIDDKNNSYQYRDSLFTGPDTIYSFIIGHDGTYIIHPDEKRIINESFPVNASETSEELDDQVAREMLEGKSGSAVLDIDGVNSSLFYAPLKDIGWSMAIAVPQHTFYHRANLVGGVILILMALGLLVAFMICRSAIKRITRPLTRFAASAREVAIGNFDAPLPAIATQDEIGLLRDSFEGMQHSLSQYVEDLKRSTASQAAMDSELKIASAIQRSMLPKEYPAFPNRDDIDVYGQLLPAKAVGGDLYDYFLRDDKLFFCIGDVSGKGVPASLVMAVTRFLFRNIVLHTERPDTIVGAINDALVENNEANMFVTLFVGVLDLATGQMQYCNAGHISPILIGAGIGTLPCDTNIPVGLQALWPFTMQEVDIKQQTTIFLYTDGLSEAEDAQQRQFGTQRMLQVMRTQLESRHHNPQALIDSMIDTVRAFAGGDEQSDDLTMLAVQYARKSNVRYQRSITLNNDINEMPQLTAFVEETFRRSNLDEPLAMQINLAIEEAVVNVMKYAYPAGTPGQVYIESQVQDDMLRFVISDSGVPFDPTARAAVDTDRGTMERGIGGLGIHLVRQIMDQVKYERQGDKNVLTLVKKL